MNKKFARLSLTFLAVLALTLAFTGIALAFPSGDNPGGTGPNQIEWTGQGASNGELDEVICPSADTLPDGIDANSYLHWILTTDGGSADNAVLHLGGTGSGSYTASKDSGGAFHFFTPYFTPDSHLTAYATFDVLTAGNGAWILTISHGCPGETDFEELTVSKTADTSFVRTHNWDITKKVETDNGATHDGYPKIWLYVDGSGDETATWTVEVTYGGYVDSDHNVSGVINIENTGTLDATITSVDDVLAGAAIDVDCGVTFPYTLPAGATLTCTYDEDGYVEGFNEASVTTERDTYNADPVEIVWGDPTTEVNASVTITDTNPGFADKYGTVTLNAYDYQAGAVISFDYSEDFAWTDYGQANCGDHRYDNTATIFETGQSASATLLVNVQCYIYETAYAKSGSGICFIPKFDQWGWTNQITPGTYMWDLWAGAGQCDTSKGTLVGTVTVVYNGTTVTVTYNVSSPYVLVETHVYAGTTMFPQVKVGKKFVDTVSPGQYYNAGPFNGGPVYVIAHAVVGIPDPNFGP